jgi:hypothetical protein
MKYDDVEILKVFLPRASEEDVDRASERVLKRIQAMRFQPESFASEKSQKAREIELADFPLAVLLAVDELQGQGEPVTITVKVAELLETPILRIISATAVLLVLLGMERIGLMASSPIDPARPEMFDQRRFTVTAEGRAALAKALAERKRGARLTDLLEGFV